MLGCGFCVPCLLRHQFGAEWASIIILLLISESFSSCLTPLFLGLPIRLASFTFPFLPLRLFLFALFRLVISPRNRRRYVANSASLLSLCPAPPIPSPLHLPFPNHWALVVDPPPPSRLLSIANSSPVWLAPALSVLCVVPLPLATDTYHVQISPV